MLIKYLTVSTCELFAQVQLVVYVQILLQKSNVA